MEGEVGDLLGVGSTVQTRGNRTWTKVDGC